MPKTDSVRFRFSAPRMALILLSLLFPWSLGCGREEGPPRAAVQGQVTLDGQPVSEGLIRFIPSGGTKGPAAMAAIHAGAFALDREHGPIIGAHRVEIEATGHQGFAIDDEAAYVANVEKKGGRMPPNPIPDIYNRRSSLTAEISVEGPNELKFQLSTQGGQTAQR
jgi:hypothetical protein